MLEALRAELDAIASHRKALRDFGLVMAGVLLAVTTFLAYKADWQLQTGSWIVGGFALLFGVGGLAAPVLLRWPHRVWMILAIILGFIMTRVILTLVFLLVVTPIGLALRLLGKDPLTKGFDPSLSSYWIDKEYGTRDRERFRKYY